MQGKLGIKAYQFFRLSRSVSGEISTLLPGLIRTQKLKQCKHWQTRRACAVHFTPPDEKQFSTL